MKKYTIYNLMWPYRSGTVTALIISAAVLMVVPAKAQNDVYLQLSTSERPRLEIALAPVQAPVPGESTLMVQARQAMEIIRQDLDFSLYFMMIPPPDSQPGYGFMAGRVTCGSWQLLGVKVVVVPELAAGTPALTLRLYDVGLDRETFNYTLPLAGPERLRLREHQAADAIVRQLTGERGVAATRLAFGIQNGRQRRDLALVDYDGHNLECLTDMGVIALSPDWRRDGYALVFAALQPGRQTLYTLAVGGRPVPLSSAAGMHGTPAWSPDGKRLAFTSSHEGDPEIYVRGPAPGSTVRLTHSWAIDCSPSWSPTGRELAFTSDRAGTPQIYLMDAEGANVRRLTFSGNYNTSPAWSPQGDRIAYVARIENHLQVCTISLNGENLVQLTTEGNNEDPAWSPDGLHLVFSSSVDHGPDLWVMHYDGSGKQRSTTTHGAVMPAWGPGERPEVEVQELKR
jgi:TolB protein